LADLRQIDIVFKTPPGNTPDYYALDFAAMILAGGKSSRLYQELVKQKEVVQEVYAWEEERRGTGTFGLEVSVRPGKKPEDIEKLLYAALDRLKTEPVKDEEMEKVRMQVKSATVGRLEGTSGRAQMLAEFAVFYDDPGLISTLPEKYAAVTKEQIRKAVETYLTETNRTVVTTVPKPDAAGKGK
jgi:zinc protease